MYELFFADASKVENEVLSRNAQTGAPTSGAKSWQSGIDLGGMTITVGISRRLHTAVGGVSTCQLMIPFCSMQKTVRTARRRQHGWLASGVELDGYVCVVVMQRNENASESAVIMVGMPWQHKESQIPRLLKATGKSANWKPEKGRGCSLP